MSQKSRHSGDVEIVSLGTGANDGAANGTITLRPNVVVTGNLTVQGTTSSINTTDTTIKDRIITLNSGETGAGITLNTSGIEIDRGSSPKVYIQYNETKDAFELVNASAVGVELAMNATKITGLANPTNASDAATKDYVDNITAGVSTSGINEDDTSVIVHDSGSNGVVDVTVDGAPSAQFNSTGLKLIGSTVGSTTTTTTISTNTSKNLTLAPATNILEISASTLFKYQSPAPGSDAGGVLIYSANSGTGTKLNYKHSAGTGELVSKSQAIIYGIIL